MKNPRALQNYKKNSGIKKKMAKIVLSSETYRYKCNRLINRFWKKKF